jgi:hypothetical protein
MYHSEFYAKEEVDGLKEGRATGATVGGRHQGVKEWKILGTYWHKVAQLYADLVSGSGKSSQDRICVHQLIVSQSSGQRSYACRHHHSNAEFSCATTPFHSATAKTFLHSEAFYTVKFNLSSTSPEHKIEP